MQRRRWLQLAAGSSALALAGGTGALWLSGAPAPVARFPDTDTALRWLATLVQDVDAHTLGAWPLAQVLEHAAQSVECSIDGYPQLRSPAFRATLGPLAFRTFARRGQMAHDTAEPIPGAPALVATDVSTAAARLTAALSRFEQVPEDESLAPHFAYGELDKASYRRAHLMHLADHAREIVVT